MSQHHVNPDLIHRTAWGNPLWNALHKRNTPVLKIYLQ